MKNAEQQFKVYFLFRQRKKMHITGCPVAISTPFLPKIRSRQACSGSI
jgi:hypothetical protein